MNWQEICDAPAFRDLPFKMETNRWGKIEMSPATNEHGMYQVALIEWLIGLAKGGRPISECSIQTEQGVKVADVAWGSYEFFQRNKRKNPYPESPEIVIEILSPSNSRKEMRGKRKRYFAAGAKEVWLCAEDGRMAFFSPGGEVPESRIVAGFPGRVEIDFA
uniref:Restriction endonuclease n=1 Tax=Candidatus Kentrum sp. SD TaxID=2126332 RepID=A0A450YKU8_9GAMM|nr:MAG: Putative restriction endonuclease [Candidatus Kentron sp. SD]VFK42129.1 MAG: Putative restriction endonuclease [Candidatus Kentron sp. SD]VFK78957.1 MAG: Putative restriction endonuclease [Candidatus Kentron sp. SD]